MKKTNLLYLFILLFVFGCSTDKKVKYAVVANHNLERAEKTLNSIYDKFSVQGTNLLRENYPFDENEKYTATYLATEDQRPIPNQYSFLWPYSGTFSAVNALLETSGDNKYQDIIENKVLNGLEEYLDTKRTPHAYASYISSASESDRFYDDNVWLGIDFTDTYMATKNIKYLDKAKLIWTFIESGIDKKLDGGIYWCEQKKESKNTCSNAPGAVYAFKLFEATKDSSYFYLGKNLYEWTKKHLQDPTDYLYFDNIALNGEIGKAKYAYNSGQMMQAAALLYKLTNDKSYLTEAQNIGKACYNYFFTEFESPDKQPFRLLKKGDIWFTAVMFRGFVELYNQDKNRTYIDAFDKNLDYIWNHSRDTDGLFNVDWSGNTTDEKKWLLTQAAMVEMYARIANLTTKN